MIVIKSAAPCSSVVWSILYLVNVPVIRMKDIFLFTQQGVSTNSSEDSLRKYCALQHLKNSCVAIRVVYHDIVILCLTQVIFISHLISKYLIFRAISKGFHSFISSLNQESSFSVNDKWKTVCYRNPVSQERFGSEA